MHLKKRNLENTNLEDDRKTKDFQKTMKAVSEKDLTPKQAHHFLKRIAKDGFIEENNQQTAKNIQLILSELTLHQGDIVDAPKTEETTTEETKVEEKTENATEDKTEAPAEEKTEEKPKKHRRKHSTETPKE
ncbi:hypothetical protein TVAG_081760 [Trichomonas vaginalis G3]|uniref:Uncharacterized protein n=1 Tax=Trichomonas vaginalis (strain ATCC PRA-98 / G3) TaxID=412133 RepID=A2E6W8_TRIV3|nr:hypothetical protein TVAGG3_0492990 [Trichomonas vaginalis G3]EAY11604.1 hypothetical protein TVAG_081760 [Trichomonas vaginalis G3]KAI5516513.1 hypothetical protein TVAGG3_0492990 [Trichomonas vaginalis G3]|eukprot:XP_001323827.1 hypothetical protein [Trichomonas vaginalis G3]